MKRYFIRTWNFEGSMVCEYGYTQWKEIIANFKSVGRYFEAWAEDVDGNVVEYIEYTLQTEESDRKLYINYECVGGVVSYYKENEHYVFNMDDGSTKLIAFSKMVMPYHVCDGDYYFTVKVA